MCVVSGSIHPIQSPYKGGRMVLEFCGNLVWGSIYGGFGVVAATIFTLFKAPTKLAAFSRLFCGCLCSPQGLPTMENKCIALLRVEFLRRRSIFTIF